MKYFLGVVLALLMMSGAQMSAGAELAFPGAKPGKAAVSATEEEATLSNALLSARFVRGQNGVRPGGMYAADGSPLLAGGTELFSITLADGRVIPAGAMKASAWSMVELPANPKAARASEQVPGKALRASFKAPDGGFAVEWVAVLRDDSHYIRQELTIKALRDTAFKMLTPLQCKFVTGGEPEISGNTTHGTLVINEKLFAGLETPMSLMRVGEKGAADSAAFDPKSWAPGAFQDVFGSDVPPTFVKKYGEVESDGPVAKYVKKAAGEVRFDKAGACELRFLYRSGNHKLSILGVTLCDSQGAKILSQDVHPGFAGDKHTDNVYRVQVPAPGTYTLQYWVDTHETVTSTGSVELSLPPAQLKAAVSGAEAALVQGCWERKTTLAKGQSWQVSSVVGLFAPGQQRRSFLVYSEREKAVPYRVFVHYNDWYEVGIRLHDNDDPLQRTTDKIWRDILANWERELFKKRKTYIDAFVIDDGWDDFNSLWEFHAGFPNGFSAINRAAGKMKAGIGTWLGPVGGYGKSKGLRLAHWNKKHPGNRISNFELSNREYFNAFVGRCRDMIKKYDMRYFKFDGISTSFHAKGPAGLEDAEGIISVVQALRRARADVFINATVGTWASPFWYHYVDSVWRQENDFGQVGNMGDARDKWISYRDRLVYEVFVQGAPLFPINSLMTHGTIITRNGPPKVMSADPQNCVKEMRAAFGCGSGLQEVYVDAELMNRQDGRLWDELAACIAWIRRNEDVLADVHWVGGNPWNGSDGDIYGWAAWNKDKCTLTLRNSSAAPKAMRTTLRELFDVPPSLRGAITLRSSFADQRALPVTGKAVDIDEPLELALEPMEVLVMEGTCSHSRKKPAKSKNK